MIRRRFSWPGSLLMALLAMTSVWYSAPAQAQAEPASAEQLPQLAESGQFDELLTRLRQEYQGQEQAEVQSLIQALERYETNKAERHRELQQAHDDALVKLDEHLEADEIEQALGAAIDAHSLAENPDAVLHQPSVTKLVQRTEEAAEQAEQSSDWVRALRLYRMLDLLFDDHKTYHEQYKQAQRHVRVLQIYAPEKLEELYQAQEARRAAQEQEQQAGNVEEGEGELELELPEAEFDPFDVDHEPWQLRLKDVELAMLHRALEQAAEHHITATDRNTLMRGAFDSMLVFVRTEALAEPFTALRDQAKRDEFRHYLERVSATLQAPDNDLTESEAIALIDRVLETNDQTLGLPRDVLIYEMAEGLMQTLDEFSAVVWPRQRELFARSTRGNFSGIGVKISRREGELTIESPLLGTPAYRAGIRADDVIAEVNGEKTVRWSLDKAVNNITGPEGTIVNLGIRREGEPELIEYQIRRSRIDIETVLGWAHSAEGDWDYMIDPQSRIGYVRISQFLPQTADDLDDAVEQMQQQGPVNGLILDLRYNPGGLLSTAIQIADRFVSDGPIVFTVDANGNRISGQLAQRHQTYQPFPVTVLINEASASASEIVSGTLQDHGRAVVVGSRSFGKGSVQDVLWYPDRFRRQWAIKLTTQYYMLPQGRIIHRKPGAESWGIEPNLVVEMTGEQMTDALELRRKLDVLRNPQQEAAPGDDEPQPEARELVTSGVDPQLEAALLVLKTRLTARQIAVAHMDQ